MKNLKKIKNFIKKIFSFEDDFSSLENDSMEILHEKIQGEDFLRFDFGNGERWWVKADKEKPYDWMRKVDYSDSVSNGYHFKTEYASYPINPPTQFEIINDSSRFGQYFGLKDYTGPVKRCSVCNGAVCDFAYFWCEKQNIGVCVNCHKKSGCDCTCLGAYCPNCKNDIVACSCKSKKNEEQ